MIVQKYRTIPHGTAVQHKSGRKGIVVYYLEANRHIVRVKWDNGEVELAPVEELELVP